MILRSRRIDPLLDLFDGVGLTTPAVDLGPAGDSRFHSMTGIVVLDGILIEQRPGLGGERVRSRSDDRHLTADNVQELRQFVEAGASQERTDARDAWIVAPCQLLGVGVGLIGVHGAEFQHLNQAVVEAVALLPEQYRAPAVELDQQGNGE